MLQLCLTLCDPMDCNLPVSSVHGIFLARILEWVAIFYSMRSSWPRNWTHVSCIAGGFFTAESPGKPLSFTVDDVKILHKEPYISMGLYLCVCSYCYEYYCFFSEYSCFYKEYMPLNMPSHDLKSHLGSISEVKHLRGWGWAGSRGCYDTGHDIHVQRRALEIIGQRGPTRIMRIYIYVMGKHLKGDCN